MLLLVRQYTTFSESGADTKRHLPECVFVVECRTLEQNSVLPYAGAFQHRYFYVPRGETP